MVAAGEVAEIKHNAVHGVGPGIFADAGVAVQNHAADMVQAVFLKAASGGIHSCLLDVKGQNLSAVSGQAAQKLGVVTVSGGGVYTEGSLMDVVGDKLVAEIGHGKAAHRIPH